MAEQVSNAAPVTTQAAQNQSTTTSTTTQATSTPAATAADPKAAVAGGTVVTDGAAAAAAQQKTEATTAKVVPEKYEFKMPDGTLLRPGEIEAITKLSKERGLSAEEAQQVLEERSGIKADFQKEIQQDFSQLREQWKQSFIADKEIGGLNARESAEHAKRAVDKFASPELKQALNENGFGDHPELIRVFARIGRAMAEDKHVPGGQAVAAEAVRTADLLYPSHSKKE